MNAIIPTATEKVPIKRLRRVYWQSALFMLMVFLAFTRWLPGGGELTPEQGLRGRIEIGLVFLAFLFVWLAWGKKPILEGFRQASFVCLVLFCLWAAASAFWSPNLLLSLGKAFGLLLVIFLASAVAYQSVRMNLPLARIVFANLMMLIVFLIFLNLFEFGALLKIDWQSARPRLSLAYEHPNTSATILALGILIGTYLLMRTRVPTRWLVNIPLVLTLAFLLYMTDSRTAIIATLFSTALLFSSALKPNNWIVALLFLITLVINIIFFLSILGSLDQAFRDFFVQNPEWLTLNGRTRLWEAVINNSATSTLFGVGYYGSRYILDEIFTWGNDSHSSYIEVFFANGLVGLALLVAFYISSLSIFKNWRVYPLPLILLVYASIESLVGVKLFAPGLIMFIICLFIFHRQFMYQKNMKAALLLSSRVDP